MSLSRSSRQFRPIAHRIFSSTAHRSTYQQVRKMSDLSIEQSMNEKFASQSKKGQGESEAFLSAFKERRTYYQISKNAAIPDSRVEEIVKYTIKHVPSSL